MKLYFAVLLAGFAALFTETDGHGRLIEPPNRSSVWRDPRWAHLDLPKNYNDMELFCGRDNLQADHPGSHCGVCGDPPSDPRPRANEKDGEYYRGIITGDYRAGQVIDVLVEIIAPHLGFFEWRLCTDVNDETQECFNRNLLQRADGSGSRFQMGNESGNYSTRLTLPEGLTCSHCVIQWNYRTENRWGDCGNGTGAIGCGPQEIFRGCSDVRIS